MGVDGEIEPAAAPGSTVVAHIVVGERLVVVPDQEPVLVREVLDPVRLRVGEAEVVRARLQALVVPTVVLVLGEVRVEERLRHRPRCPDEAVVRPARVDLAAVGRQAGDRDVVNRDPVTRDCTVCPIAEAELDRLVGIGREVGGHRDPGRRPESVADLRRAGRAGDAVAEVLTVLVVVRRRGRRNGRERRPAVRRHLDVSVIPARLDLVSRLERETDRPGPERNRARHVVVEVVAGTRVIEVASGERCPDGEVDLLVG